MTDYQGVKKKKKPCWVWINKNSNPLQRCVEDQTGHPGRLLHLQLLVYWRRRGDILKKQNICCCRVFWIIRSECFKCLGHVNSPSSCCPTVQLHPTSRFSVLCSLLRVRSLKVLPDVLLVLVSLLLSELGQFVLQLDDGSLDLIVLTDQRHPAVKNRHKNVSMVQYMKDVFKWDLTKQKQFRVDWSKITPFMFCLCTLNYTNIWNHKNKPTLTQAHAVWLLLTTGRSFFASSGLGFASCTPTKQHC